MSRRKYRYKNRAEAEDAWLKTERQRLLAEWFATALIQEQTTIVAKNIFETHHRITTGFFTLRHSSVVFAYYQKRTGPHCLIGIWDADSDELRELITSFVRIPDAHDLGIALDKARREAYAEVDHA